MEQPSPRNRFTERDLYQWLGTPYPWFEKGSDLYEAACLLRDCMDVPERDVLYVGEPVATRCTSSEDVTQYGRTRRQIVPAMLFAMAVECWLKGLVVAAIPRQSSTLWRQLSERIQIPHAEDLPDDEYLDALLCTLDDPAFQSLLRSVGEHSHLENTRAWKSVGPLNHNLTRLADAAGVQLDEEDREYLKFLTGSISVGRYPAAKSIHLCVQWESGEPVDCHRWSSLARAIHAAYEDRVSIRDLNSSEETASSLQP